MGSPDIDRWINTKDTEAIYEKYKVESGITDFSTFAEKLKASVPPAMASELTDERLRRLFNDYLGVNVEELEEEILEENLTKEQSEKELQARLDEFTKVSKKKLYEEPIIIKQKTRTLTGWFAYNIPRIVPTYVPKEYNRKYQLWTAQQIRWIQSRKQERNNKNLTKEFNAKFRTFRSISSIKTQKGRLKKKK